MARKRRREMNDRLRNGENGPDEEDVARDPFRGLFRRPSSAPRGGGRAGIRLLEVGRGRERGRHRGHRGVPSEEERESTAGRGRDGGE